MKRQHLSCLGHFSPFQYGGQYKPNQSFRLSQVNHVIRHVKQSAVVTQRSSRNLSPVLLQSSASSNYQARENMAERVILDNYCCRV